MFDLSDNAPEEQGLEQKLCRKLVWVEGPNGWSQEPRNVVVGKRVKKSTSEYSPFCPSVTYAIMLLSRMEPKDREKVLSKFRDA